MHAVFRSAFTTTVALVCATTVQAAGWTVLDLGPQGGASAFALNDNGWVVFGNRVLAPGTAGYTVQATLLNALGNSSDLSLVGINNANQAVGNDGSSGRWQAFVWQSGTRTNLPQVANYAGIFSSQTAGINNSGQVVGNAGDTAVIWNPSPGYASITQLGVDFGWTIGSGQAMGISGSGYGLLSQVYPYYRTGYLNGVVDGVSSTPSTIAPVVPGYTPVGLAINDANVVVGTSVYDCGFTCNRPFVWDTDGVSLLPVATDPSNPTWPKLGQARAINDAGLVVGSAYFAGYDVRADMWTETPSGWVQTDLNTVLPADSPFWKLTDAYDINNKGQILGLGWTNGDPSFAHVFLLTPVPEPETYAMLLAGLGLLGGTARRRKTTQ